MAKKLITMTWEDMKSEMSIAGDPDKITGLGMSIMETIEVSIDWTNRAEMINIEFALQRIIAEIKGAQRRYDNSKKITQTFAAAPEMLETLELLLIESFPINKGHTIIISSDLYCKLESVVRKAYS